MKNNKNNIKTETELTGKLQTVKNGYGIVQIADGAGELWVAEHNLHGAVHGDTVRLRVFNSERRNRNEGVVTAIVKRSNKTLVGRAHQQKGCWWIKINNQNYPQLFLLEKSKLTLQEEMVLTVQLVPIDKLEQTPVARVIESLGNADDAAMEIEIALRKFDLPHEFSAACNKQIASLPNEVRPADEKGRKDLTTLPLVTIDGEDARDFDDAVFAEEIKHNGRRAYRLVVAIADVSHYVKDNTALNTDAVERATSVYFPRRVIPMLPEKLSNGLCSLNPKVKRLAMVADMQISATGKVQSYQFYPAVIRSHARLTYTKVAAVLEQPNAKYEPELTALKPQLFCLHKLFKVLYKAREKRGALDFDAVETQILSDENGKITSIEPRIRNDAHRLIEEAMLLANICAANFILQSKTTGIFRVHDQPSPDKITALREYLTSLAVPFSLSQSPQPHELQKIANDVRGRPDAQQIHMTLLRCMAQAVYTPENIGHFGLAYPSYTHFTSPIRRYPDLLVHRVIKAILQHKEYQLSLPKVLDLERAKEYANKLKAWRDKNKGEIETKKHSKAKKIPNTLQDNWQLIAAHCSMNERRADEASLDVQSWLKCQYMQQFVGQEFTATASSITSFGIFATLNEYFVDGLIHITELGNDFFIFNPDKQALIGQRTGAKFFLGQQLKVKLMRVDSDSRQIDFVLADNVATGNAKQNRQEFSKTAEQPSGSSRKSRRHKANETDKTSKKERKKNKVKSKRAKD